MENTPNRRRVRTILQNRRGQLIHALLIVTYLVVYTVVLSAAALAPTVITLLADPAPFEGAPDSALAAAAQLLLFEERVWPVAIALILIISLHSLHISHRMFGPITRIRSEAARVAAGDLSRRIYFRKHDQMAELSEAMNEMIDSFDRRMGEVQGTNHQLSARIEELRRAQFTNPGARHLALDDLAAEVARLSSQLAAFQISNAPAAAAGVANAEVKCDDLQSSQDSLRATA
jgi:methyl-accepting chemotaxis protein